MVYQACQGSCPWDSKFLIVQLWYQPGLFLYPDHQTLNHAECYHSQVHCKQHWWEEPIQVSMLWYSKRGVKQTSRRVINHGGFIWCIEYRGVYHRASIRRIVVSKLHAFCGWYQAVHGGGLFAPPQDDPQSVKAKWSYLYDGRFCPRYRFLWSFHIPIIKDTLAYKGLDIDC